MDEPDIFRYGLTVVGQWVRGAPASRDKVGYFLVYVYTYRYLPRYVSTLGVEIEIPLVSSSKGQGYPQRVNVGFRANAYRFLPRARVLCLPNLLGSARPEGEA